MVGNQHLGALRKGKDGHQQEAPDDVHRQTVPADRVLADQVEQPDNHEEGGEVSHQAVEARPAVDPHVGPPVSEREE